MDEMKKELIEMISNIDIHSIGEYKYLHRIYCLVKAHTLEYKNTASPDQSENCIK